MSRDVVNSHFDVIFMTHTLSFARNAGLVGLAAALLTLASCNQSGTPSTSQSSAIPGSIGPKANYHADWSNQPVFIQNAIAIKGRHETDLLKIPGVIGDGVGVDLSNPNAASIVVYTANANISGIPETIEGVRTRIEMVGTVTAFSYTGKYRSPIPAGVSVGDNDECAAGSIGAMVTTSGISSSPSYEASGSSSDVITTYSQPYSTSTPHFMLSCNHVFANENLATSSDQMDQPGTYDNHCNTGNGVGALYAWNYIDSAHNNYYDVALAQCDPSISGGWSPHMSPNNSYTPSNYSSSNAAIAPSVNMKVEKVGRTTGLTTGYIAAINVTIKVQYTNFVATFVDQIEVKGNFIKAGDSGSMMVTDDTHHYPVGLNFAGGGGGSFANRMDHIAQDFGLTMVTSSF